MIDRPMGQRLAMTATGALAGLSFFNLAEALNRQLLPDRVIFGAIAWAMVFFVGVLGMSGTLRLPRAAAMSALLATLVAGLLALAGLRFDRPDELFEGAIPVICVGVLTFVPLPFLIAVSTGNWRDYRVLFSEAWAILIRFAAAALFVLLVWAVLALSDALLRMVDVEVMTPLLESRFVMSAIVGATFGLGVAMVDEHVEVVAPTLLLRLLRLFLPVVLVVLGVFLGALATRGLEGLFGDLSTGTMLLVITALCATLIAAAVDQSPAEASRSRIIRWSAIALSALLVLPAALAAWAVALRVGQYGWTPDRILAAAVAALGLGYGILYLLAVLRGRGWEGRIRQANVTMALVTLVLAATLLTPLIDPQRISAQSQLSRLKSGLMGPDQLDLAGLMKWGRAGEAVLGELAVLAAEPGREALAARLAARERPPEATPRAEPAVDLRAELVDNMTLRPATETSMRDAVLASLDRVELANWVRQCTLGTPINGKAPCVMVVGKLWPDTEGQQAIVVIAELDGFIRTEGFTQSDGVVARRGVVAFGMPSPDQATGMQMIEELQSADPVIETPVVKALRVGGIDLLVVP